MIDNKYFLKDIYNITVYKICIFIFFALQNVAAPRVPPRATRPPPPVWQEFNIPPLWKRATAEMIDFSILFLLKVLVTFIAVDFFELLDLDR